MKAKELKGGQWFLCGRLRLHGTGTGVTRRDGKVVVLIYHGSDRFDIRYVEPDVDVLLTESPYATYQENQAEWVEEHCLIPIREVDGFEGIALVSGSGDVAFSLCASQTSTEPAEKYRRFSDREMVDIVGRTVVCRHDTEDAAAVITNYSCGVVKVGDREISKNTLLRNYVLREGRAPCGVRVDVSHRPEGS